MDDSYSSVGLSFKSGNAIITKSFRESVRKRDIEADFFGF